MFLERPNETQLEHLKSQYNYQPAERIDEDVTRLIEWLSKQPHLPDVTDREWLSHFIASCKYNLQKTKMVIDTYFVVRAERPDLFTSFTRENLAVIYKFGLITLFPKLTAEGNRISCLRTKPLVNDENFDPLAILHMSNCIIDLQLKEEPLYGNVVLYDLANIKMSQFLAFTPSINRLFKKCTLNSCPLKIKNIHFVNPPKYISRIIMSVNLFLPNKLQGKVLVHEKLENLHQYVSRDVLPDIYGGTAGKITDFEDAMFEYVISNKEWLESRPKADLSKLPVKSKADELLDNMEGTFRQLQFD